MEFNIYIILVNDVIPSFKFPDIFCGFTFFISFHVFNVFMDSVGLGLRLGLGHGQKTNERPTIMNGSNGNDYIVICHRLVAMFMLAYVQVEILRVWTGRCC